MCTEQGVSQKLRTNITNVPLSANKKDNCFFNIICLTQNNTRLVSDSSLNPMFRIDFRGVPIKFPERLRTRYNKIKILNGAFARPIFYVFKCLYPTMISTSFLKSLRGSSTKK